MSKYNKNTVGPGKSDSKFAKTVDSNIKKSRFSLDQIHKTTFNAGELVPCYLAEVLPGDTMDIDLAHIARLTTPITPTMDEIELDFYFFFVPNRIVWDGWQRLMGENNASPWAPASYPNLVPSFMGDGSAVQSRSIADYYGLPPGFINIYGETETRETDVSVLPYRGYVEIWNRWFRDQNLQAPKTISKGDSSYPPDWKQFSGNDDEKLFKVNKKHDYFTSALPQPLKPVVESVTVDNSRLPFFLQGSNSFNEISAVSIAKNIYSGEDTGNVGDLIGTADKRNIVQVIRDAMQLNKFLERDARGGTRYIELLKSHFGVTAEDYRLQHPEFLGSYSTKMNISQVPQTSSTDEITPQGNLAAFGMTAGAGFVCKKSFVEHGYLHGFVVARQRKTYQQGVERFWTRRDRFDFYYPEFAHISEQAVLLPEIYALPHDNAAPQPRIFGYQEAWADYRYKPNRVSGQMRSGVPNSLDVWHYGDYYSAPVFLTDSWIKDNSRQNIDRTLAVSSDEQDQFVLDLKIVNRAWRPLPVYSIPGLADHF